MDPSKIRALGAAIVFGLVLILLPTLVAAAGDLPVVLAQAGEQNGGPSNVVTTSGKSYVFEVVIVVAMFSLALFAICKSSNRT